jgi:hypothetical protein
LIDFSKEKSLVSSRRAVTLVAALFHALAAVEQYDGGSTPPQGATNNQFY